MHVVRLLHIERIRTEDVSGECVGETGEGNNRSLTPLRLRRKEGLDPVTHTMSPRLLEPLSTHGTLYLPTPIKTRERDNYRKERRPQGPYLSGRTYKIENR